jgi:hypothetical protein
MMMIIINLPSQNRKTEGIELKYRTNKDQNRNRKIMNSLVIHEDPTKPLL